VRIGGMEAYKSRYGRISGTDAEVVAKARREYRHIQKLTPRRRPYVRSRYFKKDKVFLNLFWEHLAQKQAEDQIRRLRYFLSSVELLRHTTAKPSMMVSKASINHILFRFYGEAKGWGFYVQVKQNKRSGRKDLISVFPARKK
jgi:hypothetical protein